jgi:ABC-type proline/glycine betaine transport system substrate-binding protein
MNLTERFFEMTSDVRDRVSAYTERTAAVARVSVDKAAERVEAAAGPIEALSVAATRLNKLAYQYTDQMLTHQMNALTGALQDGAQRLRLINKAQTLQGAYQAQVKYFDVSKDRVVRDAKTAWHIVGNTGKDVKSLARDTYANLAAKPVRKPVRKTVGRSRKAA